MLKGTDLGGLGSELLLLEGDDLVLVRLSAAASCLAGCGCGTFLGVRALSSRVQGTRRISRIRLDSIPACSLIFEFLFK